MDTRSLETTSPPTTATWRLWRPVGSETETALASALEVPKAMVDAAEVRLVTVQVQMLGVASRLARRTLEETRLATATTLAAVGRSVASPESRP